MLAAAANYFPFRKDGIAPFSGRIILSMANPGAGKRKRAEGEDSAVSGSFMKGCTSN